MGKAREDVAFAREALDQLVLRQFQRNLPFERAVKPLRQPHEAHPAAAQFTDQAIWTHRGSSLQSGGVASSKKRQVGLFISRQRRQGPPGADFGPFRQHLAQSRNQTPRGARPDC